MNRPATMLRLPPPQTIKNNSQPVSAFETASCYSCSTRNRAAPPTANANKNQRPRNTRQNHARHNSRKISCKVRHPSINMNSYDRINNILLQYCNDEDTAILDARGLDGYFFAIGCAPQLITFCSQNRETRQE